MNLRRPACLPTFARLATHLVCTGLMLGWAVNARSATKRVEYRSGFAGVHVTPAVRPVAVEIRAAEPGLLGGRKEVVFVDTSVADYPTLEAGVRRGMAIVEIGGAADGLAQMAAWAEAHGGYAAMHVLSHGGEGRLQLGTLVLDEAALKATGPARELERIGHALRPGGDLLLYGCDVAAGSDGARFIHDLSALTGANVAASTDATGAARRGGNWTLEQCVGRIATAALNLRSYAFTLTATTTGNDPGAAYANTQSNTYGDIAQSFTATKTGLLTSITLYGSTTSTSTLNVYSGDGTGGPLLATQQVAAFNAAGDADVGFQRYIGSTITLSSSVSITNGNQYTFQLTNVDGVSVTFTTASDYAGGTAYDTGSEIDPTVDLEFTVLQGDANSAPVNTVVPAVSGTSTVGHTLTTTTGTWTDPDSDALTFSYQWYRADDASGTNAAAISSATGSSFTLTTSQAHKYVRAVVTANDGNGHTPTANTAWTAVTNSAPANTVAPALSGTTAVGNALSATTGTWSDADGDTITYSYQWYRADDSSGTNAAAISSATASSYTLTSSDGGKYVRVVVTANDSHGSSNQTAASSWTAVYTVPSVSSIARTGGASATVSASASSVSYTVTFSESVTGVDASDFGLTATGTASGSVASVSGSGATYTVTVNSLSGDGTLRLDLNSSGTGIQNGNAVAIASGYTSGATYTLDHTAPSAPSTPDMTSGTDTGASSSDNITSNTTPTFTGTAEAGSTVTLYDTDGTTVVGTTTATGGSWSITSSALSSGSHTLTAKATDAAGSQSAASSGLTLTIDTSAPTGLGLSATTFATTSATSTATLATISATDSSTLTYTLAVGNGTNDANNGSFTVSGASLKVGGAALSAGTYKIYLAATDTAGNVVAQAFTLTVANPPSVSSIARTGGASATVSASASSVSYTVTFSESVTGVDASDFGLTATGTASGSVASVSGSGATYTVTVNSLSGDGTLRLDLNSSGTGIQNGNAVAIASGYTAGATYTLDHTAPNAPSTPDMTSGTDTGASSSDNITSNTTPTFTGTAEAGSTVTLYDTDGTTVVGTTTATGGSWSITSSALSSGSHTLTAKASDAAGNQSAASSGLTVTIDTTAPTGLGLSATTFATTSATSTATLATISATDSSTLTYTLAVGNGTNDADNGSFTVSGALLKVGGAALSAGTYKIYLAATDTAGNVVAQAFTLTVANPPSVSSIARTGGASATVSASASSVSYTVTFSESVTGVDASDFGLTATGTASGSIASVSGSGATYTVTVNSLSGDGTLRLDLNSSGTGIQNGNAVAIASGYTAGATYTLDHTAPSAPSTPDMTSGTDTGASSTDNITSNTTPTFTGTAEAGSTVTLYDTDGTTVVGTTTATGGSWSITSSALSSGSHTLTAKATDAAGNQSAASSGLTLTIDATAPTVVSVSVPSNGIYKAGDNLDFIVNLSEAVTVDTGGGTSRIALVLGATTVYATYLSGSGTSALVFRYTVAAGMNDADGITVGAFSSNGATLRDVAGNDTTLTLNSVGSTVAVTVDTTAPTITDAAISISGATGTGGAFKIGDTVTATWNNTAGGDNNGDIATVTIDFSQFGGGAAVTAANSSGTWTASFAIVAGTIDGGTSRNVSVTATDNAGNSRTTVDSTNATVDNLAPAAPSQPDLTAASDTGASSTDNLTKVTTPTFTGTADAGTTVQLYDGSTLVGTGSTSGGAWTITTSTLAAGAHSITAVATDAAGNVSPSSTALSVTIDASAPTVAISALSTDDRLNATEAASNLTVAGTTNAEDGRTVTVGFNAQTYTATVASGAWTVAIPSSALGSGLSDGAKTVTADVSDLAGNPAPQGTRTLTVDKTAPGAPVFTGISPDTGISANDQITSSGALTLSGTAEANSTVTISRVGTGVIGTATANGAGAWSFDYTATTLGAGTHSFTATATDAAGNIGAISATFFVTVDTSTTAPVITQITTDSGASSTDGITNDPTLILSGTAEKNGTVSISRTGVGVVGTATADGTGAWSFDYTGTTLTDGTYLFTATVTDPAGNTSASSADFPVTIDTTAPAAPAITAISNDTGSSSTDGITSDSTLTLSGTAEANATVTLARSGVGQIGTATANGSGVWTFDYTATTLAEGSYTFTATATDAAGNLSSPSSNFAVTVDTTAPTITSAAAASATYKSGFSYTIAASGSAVSFGATGLPAGLSIDSATGAISGQPTQNGSFTVSLSATDAAGNAGTASLTLTVNQVALTVAGVTAANKVYNTSTAATLDTSAATLVGVVGGDAVSLVTTNAAGAFADKSVGPGKVVAISGLTLAGADAAHYTLVQPTTSAAITAAPLSVAGVTAANKTYDGNAAAALNVGSATLVGVLGADNVTLNTGSVAGTFANASVGTAKPVTASGLTLAGADAANYALTQPTTSANIGAATLTVSGITAANKTYDGNTTASLAVSGATLVGVIGGDAVALDASSAAGVFADALVGNGKTVTVSGLTIAGTAAANYTLVQPTTLANVTAKNLSVTGVSAASRVYDATAAASLDFTAATLAGVVTGDAVTLNTVSAAGAFADKSVGIAKPVTISGLTLGGAKAANYVLTAPTARADITAKGVTVAGVTTANKVYDGTTTATLNVASATVTGVISGDTVTLVTTGVAGAFANANVGSGKTVSVSGLTLGGTDAGNYVLTAPTLTADITAAPVTVSLGGLTFTYDGSPKAVSATTTPAVATSISYAGTATAPANAGSYAVVATVTDPNYSGSASGTLVIAKARQSVSFPRPASVVVGAAVTLSATASTGLPITYSIVSGPGALSGSSLTVTSSGSVTVRAMQPGTANYEAASADVTITDASKLAQTITFAPVGDKRASDAAFALSATATSGLPVSFTVVSGPALIAGSTLTLSGAPGQVTVRASQAGDATYQAAPDVTQTFTVAAVGPLVYFGKVGSNSFAASVSADGKSGTMIGVLPGTGEAFIVNFAVQVGGVWSVTVPTFPVTPTGTAQTDPGTTPPVARLAADPVLRTFRGQVSGALLTGSIDGLGLTFSAALVAPTGPTAGVAGYYQSSSLDTSTGTIYSIVGTQNQVYVLAVTPTYTGGDAGAVNAAGAFNVNLGNQVAASGNVDAPTTTVTGTLTQPDRSPEAFAGLAVSTVRTDRLMNLSSRARVTNGVSELIAGFVIGGAEAKTVLLRAVGPTLSDFGVQSALAGARLRLYDARGQVLRDVQGWNSDATLATTFARVGAFGLKATNTDTALVMTLQPGSYTMQVLPAPDAAGNVPASGIALAEIYDASVNAQSEYQRLVNISSRGHIDTAEGVLIGGFVVSGNSPKRLLIRGVGPALGRLGVGDPLADPELKVYAADGTVLARNDDWSTPVTVTSGQDAATAEAITSAAQQVGAFALPAGGHDAAVIVTLPPGSYTAVVGSSNGSNGTGLIEIYELP